MNDHQQHIARILREANGGTDADVALLQEASRIADVHNDTPLGMQARVQLIDAGGRSGNPEASLAAFVWCLAKIDADQDLQKRWEYRLMRFYPWIVESISDYPQLSRQQVEDGMADMVRRFELGGHGWVSVHMVRAYALLRLGDIEGHRQVREKWRSIPRAGIAFSPAHETSSDVSFALELGEFERAFEIAEPVLAGTQRHATMVPSTYSRLLLAALYLGRVDPNRIEQARNFHLQSFRHVITNPSMLDSAGDHCAYLALTGNITKSISVFETAIVWNMNQKRPWERLIFLETAAVLFNQLARIGDQPLQLRVPDSAPFHRADDTYTPSQVETGLLRMAGEIVTAYNHRNGNDYMTRRYDIFRNMVTAVQTQELTL